MDYNRWMQSIETSAKISKSKDLFKYTLMKYIINEQKSRFYRYLYIVFWKILQIPGKKYLYIISEEKEISSRKTEDSTTICT